MTDNFSAGYTYDDDYGYEPDYFSYDLGSGTVTSGLDAQARFEAQIVNSDGTTETVTISVYQTQNGDAFVRLPDGYQITQLTIGTMVGDGYDGITTGSSSTSTVVCFGRGTWIATPHGARRIETLQSGDLVETLDHGAQPVLWRRDFTVLSTAKTAPCSDRRRGARGWVPGSSPSRLAAASSLPALTGGAAHVRGRGDPDPRAPIGGSGWRDARGFGTTGQLPPYRLCPARDCLGRGGERRNALSRGRGPRGAGSVRRRSVAPHRSARPPLGRPLPPAPICGAIRKKRPDPARWCGSKAARDLHSDGTASIAANVNDGA